MSYTDVIVRTNPKGETIAFLPTSVREALAKDGYTPSEQLWVPFDMTILELIALLEETAKKHSLY